MLVDDETQETAGSPVKPREHWQTARKLRIRHSALEPQVKPEQGLSLNELKEEPIGIKVLGLLPSAVLDGHCHWTLPENKFMFNEFEPGVGTLTVLVSRTDCELTAVEDDVGLSVNN